MKFSIEDEYKIVEYVEKEKIAIYTILDRKSYEKIKLIGVKADFKIKLFTDIYAKIDIKIEVKKIKGNDGIDSYVNIANPFIVSVLTSRSDSNE